MDRRFGSTACQVYTGGMSEQEKKSPEDFPEQEQGERPEPPPPQGKGFQIMLVQTAVFAAVFFTIIWLVEEHSAIAAVLGLGAIAFLLAKRFRG